MTPQEAFVWLRTDPDLTVLVEFDYMKQVGIAESAVPTLDTVYCSNRPFVDLTVPRKYVDIVHSIASFDRSVDRETLRGSYRVAVGAVDLDNTDGRANDMLLLAIDGSAVRVYVGEEGWTRDQFFLLYEARSARAVSPAPCDYVSVELKDTAILLNKSIGGDVAVGGTGASMNKFRPLNFGFVHNLEPIPYDSALLIYVHSDTGTNTYAYEVRDNGIPVDFTDNGDGTFTLQDTPVGQITCDVLADYDGSFDGSAYRITQTLRWMVADKAGLGALGKYATAGTAPTYEEAAANDYPLGISMPEKRNVIDALEDVMSSANSFWAISRLGSFYSAWMAPGRIEALLADSQGDDVIEAEIEEDDVVAGTMQLDHSAPSYKAYQGFGNVNQVQQTNFADSLTPDEREQFSRKGFFTENYHGEDPGSTSYLGPVAYKGGAPELYHLSMSESQEVSTLISGPTDLDFDFLFAPPPELPNFVGVLEYLMNWSAVRRALFLPWLEFVDIVVGIEFFGLELGHIVKFTHSKLGLENGELFQVCTTNISILDPSGPPVVKLGLVRRRYAGVLDDTNILLLEDSTALLQETSETILL